MRSADRLVEADRRASVGARGDVQVRAVVECGPQLRQPVLTRHDLLAGHVPAPLRPHLVFEEDARRPRGLPHLDGADDVERVAVPRVGVDDDHRRRRRAADTPGDLGHLALREIPEVGKAELRTRHAVPRENTWCRTPPRPRASPRARPTRRASGPAHAVARRVRRSSPRIQLNRASRSAASAFKPL